VSTRVHVVGRSQETSALRHALDTARAGRARHVVILGPAGSGKSTLLAHADELAGPDALVLQASGHPAEVDLPYAGLHQLLHRLDGELDDVLRAALAIGPGDPADRMAVAASVVQLLARLATGRLVVVLVDDLQWLDTASRQVLVFAARRLDADAVCVVAAARDDADELAAVATSLPLEPLRAVDSSALLDAAHPDLVPAVRAAVVAAAQGLPLALREIGGALSTGQRAGTSPLPDPLPLGPALTRLHVARLDRLSTEARHAVLVAALDDLPADELDAALAQVGCSLGDLVEAEALGLVDLHDRRCSFSHPTIRAAVIASAPRGEVERAHATLAGTSGDAVARAWHAHRSGGRAPIDVGQALVAAAERSEQLGRPDEAARCWRAAAEHAPDEPERFARAERAALAFLDAGLLGQAAEVVAGLASSAPDDLARARWVAHQLGIALWSSSPASLGDEGLRALAASLVDRSGGAGAPEVGESLAVAHDLLSVMATAHLILGVEPPGDLLVRARAGSLAATGAPSVTGAVLDAMRGDQAALDDLATRWVDHVGPPRSLGEAMDLTTAGYALLWFDRLGACERLVARCSAFDVAPRSATSAVTHLFAGLCAQRRGDWARASLELGTAAEIADHGGLPIAHGVIAHHRALHAAYCGDEALSAAVLERSRRDPGAASPWSRHVGHCVTAIGHLGRGQLELAVPSFEAAERIELDHGLTDFQPGLSYRLNDHVNALVRLGRPEAAEDVVGRVERHDHWPGVEAAVTLAQAQVHSDPALFEAAYERCRLAVHRFDEARVLLLWGEDLRRRRRRRDAVGKLRPALELFTAMGAVPWAERASAELAAAGVRRAPVAGTSPLAALTPREHAVALAVAAGATNAEAAQQLFISVRTVGYHLGHVYSKLGVHDRGALATIMAISREPAAPAG
jgi:DNA-binding CsgD family transcriptional regulator